MTAPAYHLRPNKAADRHLLMEAVGRLARLGDNGLRGYTYYGFGGPYLEDFRLMYERHPEIRMVSIEEDEETFKRQKFHLPCSSLELKNQSLSDFIAGYGPDAGRGIFWLDYTGLEYGHFTDFQRVIATVEDGSMVKVTLRAEPSAFFTPDWSGASKRWKEFEKACGDLMPGQTTRPPRRRKDLALLLQEMVKIAAQITLPAAAGKGKFAPVSSFYYSDGTPMFTITGVVCGERMERRLNEAFGDWEFANLSWGAPTHINVPILSTKERLHLQPLLPKAKSGKDLRNSLGYSIDGSPDRADDALMQYAKFHRHAPYFLKGVP